MKKLFFSVLLISLAFIAYGQEKSLRRVCEGKYFTIYGPRDLDTYSLLKKLKFNYFLHPDTVLSGDRKRLEDTLSKTMDAIFSEVSDILDIHMYSYHGTIKFTSTLKDIDSIFRSYYGKSFPERSFFLRENNTVYMSAPDATLGMLGHEIAHAIMCRYFVVPPPVKVQEVLAGYVEYNLRKATGTLKK